MKKVKIIAGIAWAFICLIIMIGFFPGYNALAGAFAKLPFMKINPTMSGGEVATSIISECCTLDVRKPVFDGLTGQRKNGFVQIDWRGNIPEEIVDTIDYDSDNVSDFALRIDCRNSETELEAFSSKVRDLGVSTATSYGWAVRVNLSRNISEAR